MKKHAYKATKATKVNWEQLGKVVERVMGTDLFREVTIDQT